MNNYKRSIEYQMSKALFDGILKSRKEGEKKQNPYKFVMKILNENYGLRGYVTRVSVI